MSGASVQYKWTNIQSYSSFLPKDYCFRLLRFLSTNARSMHALVTEFSFKGLYLFKQQTELNNIREPNNRRELIKHKNVHLYVTLHAKRYHLAREKFLSFLCGVTSTAILATLAKVSLAWDLALLSYSPPKSRHTQTNNWRKTRLNN